MEILKSIFFSLVQSLTEFLPVSSSGHLLFFKNILNFEEYGIFYDIVLHAGSLVAIIFFFYKEIKELILNTIIELKDSIKKDKNEKLDIKNKKYNIQKFYIKINETFNKKNTKILTFSIISTFVTFTFYIIFKKIFDYLIENPKILPFTFLITAILIFLSYLFSKNYKNESFLNINNKTYFFPLIIGFVQGIAILPGVSRSGSTISMALILKTNKNEAFFYSFLLSIYAIGGSFLFSLLELKGFELIVKSPSIYIYGFFFSFIFSFLTLKLLKFLINKNIYFYFSIYVLILSFFSFLRFYF
ncbi:MAG: undecaprenyl-diphosphate phosphatase [Spirochaetes bacterium]|nr:undecaprenyl-diphosphate phosphatase [Spirochaetota bacterium]